MRVLYLSQYFPPEVGATQIRAYEMARTWVRLGAEVTMIAEVPNHPSGIIPPEYRGKLVERSELDGIDVIRVWVKTSEKKGFFGRMAFYLSYMVNAFLAGMLMARGRYDLIYASSPPLFVGGAALMLSKLKRTRLIFEIRDLWPASAVALGELNNRWAIGLAEWLENRCYLRAKRIVAVAPGAIDELRDRGIPEEKLLFVANGSNTDLFRFDQSVRDHIRSELGLDDHFVVMFTGIHGLAQKLETVVKAAQLLSQDQEIHFVLVGEGPRKTTIKQMVEDLGLVNITLIGEQPRELIPGFLSAADITLAPMRDVPVLDRTMLPVKIYDAWACQRPVVLGNRGAAASMLEKAGGGIACSPEDPEALVEAILRLKTDREGCEAMGRRARDYVVKYHSRQVLAEGLYEDLVSLE